MALTFDELEQEALALPECERVTLAKNLWATFEPPVDPAIDEAWRAELRRRVDDLDSGRVKAVPGEEVMRRLRERFA